MGEIHHLFRKCRKPISFPPAPACSHVGGQAHVERLHLGPAADTGVDSCVTPLEYSMPPQRPSGPHRSLDELITESERLRRQAAELIEQNRELGNM
jgi:hypothetical protein